MNTLFDAWKAPFDSEAAARVSAGQIAMVWAGTAAVIGLVLR